MVRIDKKKLLGSVWSRNKVMNGKTKRNRWRSVNLALRVSLRLIWFSAFWLEWSCSFFGLACNLLSSWNLWMSAQCCHRMCIPLNVHVLGLAVMFKDRKIPGVASRQSPNRQSIPSAHRNRLFSSTAAEPGKNILNTAISSLFSLALRMRSAPTVFVFKFNRDENSDDNVAILCCSFCTQPTCRLFFLIRWMW